MKYINNLILLMNYKTFIKFIYIIKLEFFYYNTNLKLIKI